MGIIKWISATFFIFLFCIPNGGYAQSPFGQVMTIDTYLKWVYGSPSWLLILRDDDSGAVSPYLFDFTYSTHHWIAFSYGRTFRVTVSKLTFGPFAKINNFCGLENKVLTDTSIFLSITGILSPDPNSSFCNIRYFKHMPFTIVNGIQ